MTRVEELIQLMRLSSSEKVRLYLEKLDKKKDTSSESFLAELEDMFALCKRKDLNDSPWPPPP